MPRKALTSPLTFFSLSLRFLDPSVGRVGMRRLGGVRAALIRSFTDRPVAEVVFGPEFGNQVGLESHLELVERGPSGPIVR